MNATCSLNRELFRAEATLSERVCSVLRRRGLLVLPSGALLVGEVELMSFVVARSKLADVPGS